MSSESKTAVIRLPAARAEQLRELAHVRRTTVVAVIESIIDEAVRNGEISGEIAGFSVEPAGAGFQLKIADWSPLIVTAPQVMALSGALESINKLNESFADTMKGMRLSLERVGRGIALKHQEQQVTMTESIARDLAKHFRMTVENAITADDVPAVMKPK